MFAIKRITKNILKILTYLDKNHVSVYAAQASFFVIISMVPLIMIIISSLQYILPVDKNTLNVFLLNIIPTNNKIFYLLDNILDEVFGRTDLSILSLSAVALLWSSSRGFKSIVAGLHNIFRSNIKGGFLKDMFYSLIYTIIFIFILILSVMVIFFGDMFHQYLASESSWLYNMLSLLYDLRGLLFFVILIIIFNFVYKFTSHNNKPLRQHASGAIFAATGWLVFTAFYAVYIDKFADYSYTYGSLAAVVLLMLWLYCCINIMFWGAEINQWLFNNKYI